jgi:hypothetical protein
MIRDVINQHKMKELNVYVHNRRIKERSMKLAPRQHFDDAWLFSEMWCYTGCFTLQNKRGGPKTDGMVGLMWPKETGAKGNIEDLQNKCA